MFLFDYNLSKKRLILNIILGHNETVFQISLATSSFTLMDHASEAQLVWGFHQDLSKRTVHHTTCISLNITYYQGMADPQDRVTSGSEM